VDRSRTELTVKEAPTFGNAVIKTQWSKRATSPWLISMATSCLLAGKDVVLDNQRRLRVTV
jgi:hypothetical protein